MPSAFSTFALSEPMPNTTGWTPKPSEEWLMSLHPIKTETDYDQALAEIEALFEAQPDTPEGDRLEVLTALVEAYERKRHPVFPPDPIDALLYHLESRGMTRRDLQPYLGSRARVAEVLNRRRALTIG